MQAVCSTERLLEYTAGLQVPARHPITNEQEEGGYPMVRHVITVVRDDVEIDYLYEETVEYSPPPYKVKEVDRETYLYRRPKA